MWLEHEIPIMEMSHDVLRVASLIVPPAAQLLARQALVGQGGRPENEFAAARLNPANRSSGLPGARWRASLPEEPGGGDAKPQPPRAVTQPEGRVCLSTEAAAERAVTVER